MTYGITRSRIVSVVVLTISVTFLFFYLFPFRHNSYLCRPQTSVMKKKPLILVSNDDGINSKGIHLLVTLMKQLGEVVVVAPDGPQSGMGHAITIGNTLRLSESNIFEGVKSFQCSGTPADCVKLSKQYALNNRKPDLLVSGINHGSNTSISVIYSGTMSAALEGAIEDIPSIAFSVCDYSATADFSHINELVLKIAGQVLENGLPQGVALNVNFPAKAMNHLRA